jgi:glucan endo-1,3-alpha-glucosidase
MSSIPCSSASDASFLDQYLKEFQGHSNYLRFKGKPLVSAFSGENCKFGTGSLNEGWLNAIKNSASEPNHFVPSFFMDSSTFSAATVMDGAFNVSWFNTLIHS